MHLSRAGEKKEREMRLIRVAMAASLAMTLWAFAGTALAGGDNPRLDGVFSVDDPHDMIDHNTAFIEISGSDIFARGEVESHTGTPTEGVPDTVFIEWRTDEPNNTRVGARSAHVRQHEYAQLRIVINSNTPARNLDTGPIYPKSCAVSANMDLKNPESNVHSSCTLTDVFAELTADQISSIVTAFDGSKHVRIKVKQNGKASLKIKTFGPASEVE